MKKYTFFIICLCVLNNAIAQDTVFFSQMKLNVQQLDSAKSPEDFQFLVNNFQRISSVEYNHWLPYYYLGYCNVMLGIFNEKSKVKAGVFTVNGQFMTQR